MPKLKMVAGKTYICAKAFGPERIVTRGEVVDVSQEHVQDLLEASYHDALNNEHKYFQLVEGAPLNADKKVVRRARAGA